MCVKFNRLDSIEIIRLIIDISQTRIAYIEYIVNLLVSSNLFANNFETIKYDKYNC